ncbi:hypothetical protein [Jhaorihella thermophila]|uniref:DUF3313 domain-containing protein n=1 Tax=Jhaorihella thermophila TaxID=488547 RepID=A0A1H5V8Y1_9RHOB|nr:hypothetical protein [Jhaorihella thermophila]SEF83221.1 hypothetical protein SAMN05421751_105203 [Jhaorihella thermophila]
MLKRIALVAGLAFLAGCGAQPPISEEPKLQLGDFSLGHNIVVAPKMQKGPVSREATKEEWIDALTNAFAERLGRYDGDKLYHLGVSVEGYMLAPGGVPVLYSPKSVLVLLVTVWDDDDARKLNDKPHQLVVFENTEADSALLGSGYTRTREEQIAGLSYNAAKQLEAWLAEQHEKYGWFTDNPVFNPPENDDPLPSQ